MAKGAALQFPCRECLQQRAVWGPTGPERHIRGVSQRSQEDSVCDLVLHCNQQTSI